MPYTASAARAVRAGTISALLFPSGEICSVLTIGAVILVGVWQGPASGLTAGALVGFVFLTYRFLEPIAEFTEILDQTQTAVAGWRRVLAVLETPIEILDPTGGVARWRRHRPVSKRVTCPIGTGPVQARTPPMSRWRSPV